MEPRSGSMASANLERILYCNANVLDNVLVYKRCLRSAPAVKILVMPKLCESRGA